MPGANPYAQPIAPVPGGRKASMGARLGGLVVDAIVTGVPVGIIGAAGGAFHRNQSCDAFGNNCTTEIHPIWWLYILGAVVGLAYAAYFVGVTTRTIGHRAAGIRVVDLNTGGPIGPGRAILRWFVLTATGLVCTLGYWSPFFDSQRRQGWHDKASNSVVIPNGP
jgi:uncharacterized RDD family membrane protein YckC